jgi:hypothetical protein
VLADDARIRYLRLPAGAPLGTKRNVACEAGSGELIAHWDDDDWFGPDRLSLQIEALLASDADACGARSFRCLRLRNRDAWTYRPAPEDAPWVVGATLVYRRTAWERNHFPSLSCGEDTTFVRRLGVGRVRILDDLPSYVAVRHGTNTSAFNAADRRWTPLTLTHLAVVLGGDWTFYLAESCALRRIVERR